MEMNTRIQVEHPVTEMVTGIDLVAWQIRIAAGERLTLDGARLRTARPRHRVSGSPPRTPPPTSRRASARSKPTSRPGGPGVRVDSHLYAGYAVPPHYDSLLAKIIVWGRDRAEAVQRLDRALAETVITGLPQTVAFHRRLAGDEAFRRAELHTGFIAEHAGRLLAPAADGDGPVRGESS